LIPVSKQTLCFAFQCPNKTSPNDSRSTTFCKQKFISILHLHLKVEISKQQQPNQRQGKEFNMAVRTRANTRGRVAGARDGITTGAAGGRAARGNARGGIALGAARGRAARGNARNGIALGATRGEGRGGNARGAAGRITGAHKKERQLPDEHVVVEPQDENNEEPNAASHEEAARDDQQ
jgi:hypothetical protein